MYDSVFRPRKCLVLWDSYINHYFLGKKLSSSNLPSNSVITTNQAGASTTSFLPRE
ncbi:hypothetical protein SP15_295 [Bacillus phage SP-15]|uniref:Uncharacterized protein n=1 Tax=Bacillus phage SP-15 TaxID=1792032 RepID=A0A127AX18_9CAUD|nr:hypothetical protein SP15_295 [Bacillus phage SP-15]AMM45103.1 hypothetical protein SP15_295 [Bacillus phage SP-15]